MQLVSKENVLSFSILFFLIIFYMISFVIKPSFLYNTDGSIKQFGLGYKNKTIIPFWLMAIGIAVLSYLFIFYFSVVKVSF
jgi:hypothetical protein|uniref:Uncharacterized protein n=1 Tax=viral metagenome TaxID=1070528 RepID=A0A6C0LJQ5_9ZZZZ|tara:strand:- start:482 stop:724 length:243 start_codon:yes stop_codon:yes gene_type:complete